MHQVADGPGVCSAPGLVPVNVELVPNRPWATRRYRPEAAFTEDRRSQHFHLKPDAQAA